jgi:ankyrin repeat protein
VKIWYKYTNDTCTTDDWPFYTPLPYAAEQGRVEVVRVLLEGGAKVEGTDADQRTALHYAARHGHLEVCRLLLDWGANVNAVDWRTNTPLHWAAYSGRLAVVKLLVERGADVRMKNDYGPTASDLARKEGYVDLANWLNRQSTKEKR